MATVSLRARRTFDRDTEAVPGVAVRDVAPAARIGVHRPLPDRVATARPASPPQRHPDVALPITREVAHLPEPVLR
jgi:hypothetical protein